ncbi:hypothetical protein [Francisella sp. 19X1-34]|uniref:hypothetical protein n=1 Tax=Francisella sp. 19X1-34 TaxID=3087177 RepID=UPI002E304A7B|nr:hypothetical protein [Francisella sp. 19X1-34]MED7788111.1 hypothetical protein [Francisella sp. 19X1-34]
MNVLLEKQSILSIFAIGIMGVVVFIIIIKMYKKLMQRTLFYKKGLGKINTFFAKLFKVNALNEIYLEFYKSLSLWERFRLYFARKNILINSSLEVEDEFGIYFKLDTNHLSLYINPKKLYKSRIKEADILCLFNKVFKGRINLVVVNVGTRLDNKGLTSQIDHISMCFADISRYLSSSFSYIVNIVEQDNNIYYETWRQYAQVANIKSFWVDEKPSLSWFDIVTTKYTDKQLYLGEQPFSSKQIRDLYCFLNNHLRFEYFINSLQSEISNKVALYGGFGIDLIKTGKLFRNSVIEKDYFTQKFTKKLKKKTFLIVLLLLIGCFIVGWYKVKNNISNIANQIPLTCKYSGSLSEINLKNYQKSLNETFYSNLIVTLAYHNAGKKHLDNLWERFIYKHVILRALSKTNNPIQRLALNILQNQITNPYIRELVSDNLWLWSKVTKVPENVLRVWLEVAHDKTNLKREYDLSSDRREYNNITEYINDFIVHIFKQKNSVKIPLDRTVINRALELALLDQLLNDHNLSIHIHDSKLRDQLSLSYEQRVVLNHFITYLELRDVIETVVSQVSTRDKVDRLANIENSIKQLAKTPWDRKLVSFMLQSVSDNFYLSSQDERKDYYSYNFYEKNIKPINLKLLKTVKAYAEIGININPIYTKFKLSLDKYKKAYKNYYYQKALDALEVDSRDIYTLLFSLKRISTSSNIEPLLLSIQKNVLQHKNVFMSEKSFKGINNFHNNLQKYNKIMDKYIDILNKTKSNPEILIKFYQNDKHPFKKDVDEFLQSTKVTPELARPLSQPALASEQVTTALLQEYVQKYWRTNLQGSYNKVFDSFPFKEDATNEISVDTLIKTIGKDGKFWRSYAKIAPLIRNYKGNKWLTDGQFKEYQKISKLSKLLWDANGKPKPIKFTLKTSELLPSYSHVETSWIFFKDKKTSYYEGVLSIGENSISDIGVGEVKRIFEVQWWLNKPASIALVSDKKDLIAQQVIEGDWSFWKLLKSADRKGNIFYWNFNNDNTDVSFDINYSKIWLN